MGSPSLYGDIMRLITKEEIYDVKACDTVKIKCGICGDEYTRRVNSIRSNIKINGIYRCHGCAQSSKEYLDKQKKSHPKDPNAARYTLWMSKVDVVCSVCGKKYNMNYRTFKLLEKHGDPVICRGCGVKRAHADGKMDHIYSEDHLERLRENGEKFWDSIEGDEWKIVYMKDKLDDPEYKKLMSECGKKPWKNPKYKKMMAGVTKNMWEDDEFRSKMAIVRSDQLKVSNIQLLLYSILDDLGVEYYGEYRDTDNDPETIIGPYSFDCVIPRNGEPDLLIECQGDYWHNIESTVSKDIRKADYINKNFSGMYELKYLWEHEFECLGKISDLVKFWLGINDFGVSDFEFSDVDIKRPDKAGYKLLLGKYHYHPNAGRNFRTILGGYLGGDLIAVSVFSKYGCESGVCMSRLCIHPCYKMDDFAEWFVDESIKQLPGDVSQVVAHDDLLYDGDFYLSCGFVEDGEVDPGYWYICEGDWVMYAETMRRKASAVSMSI